MTLNDNQSSATANLTHQPPQGRPSLLALSALGIVFGDIGTSPLYTFKTILGTSGHAPSPAAVLGALSLVLWTLFIITTVKYVLFAMRVDNDGEGGILALMALLGVKKQRRPTIVALGLFGAALIYGDGAITPAISVLSALEGLNMATPALQPYVVPAAVIILLAVFAIQSRGTGVDRPLVRAGHAGVVHHDRTVGYRRHGEAPGGVCGAQPDLRHIVSDLRRCHRLSGAGGSVPVRHGGGSALCRYGAFRCRPDQARLVCDRVSKPDFQLCWSGGAGARGGADRRQHLLPALSWLPAAAVDRAGDAGHHHCQPVGHHRSVLDDPAGDPTRLDATARIKQTSSEGYGQIYVGIVNWLLMVITVGLTIGFGKSDNLASAYGIAVSLTMLMTSALLFIAMREIWHWSLPAAAAVAAVFLTIDSAFFLANLTKIAEGGYVPLLLAVGVYGIMWIWHRGAAAVSLRMHETLVPVPQFMADIAAKQIPRVPGTAVFLTRAERDTPPVMLWHVKHNRALHEHLFVLRVDILSVPWVAPSDRLKIEEVAPNFWRAECKFRFHGASTYSGAGCCQQDARM